jgi:hypothetical protein
VNAAADPAHSCCAAHRALGEGKRWQLSQHRHNQTGERQHLTGLR